MATSTIFKNFATPVGNKSLILISKDIASDKYKAEVEEIQSLLAQGKVKEAAEKKQQLPAFTPSATFTDKRLLQHLEHYSGFVHLDFDKLTPLQMETAFQTIASIPFTFLCFRSPSGNGLKVFVEVSTDALHHDIAYKQVQLFYEEKIGIPSDSKCKDITRLCFMSYHPELYKNISNQKFTVILPKIMEIAPKLDIPVIAKVEEVKEEVVEVDDTELKKSLLECKRFTEQKKEYIEGSRNEFIYTLASNCNRKGITQDVALQFAQSNYDLPDKEIVASFKSAYSNHSAEFAKFANPAMLQKEDNTLEESATSKIQNTKPTQPIPDDDPLEDYLKSTPMIPDEVFSALPHLLKEGARAFTDKRKRDVFFTGAIAIISGCLPNVTGVYFQERVYPHLYTFIIAPAASGKGVLKNAKRLADKYHQKILQKSKDAQKVHEAAMSEFKMLERSKKPTQSVPEKPLAPPFKIVFIPADCSKARMIEHLKANDGQGIICETEADTMSSAKKQDWGDYSTILRAAFHHETIASTRKTDNQYDEINEPRLAVTLSGTPAQAPRLLSSAEDGLFSRFLFYSYKNNIEWQDPSPQSNAVVYNDHFEALSVQVLEIITLLEQSPTNFQLTLPQWQIINTKFPSMLAEVVTYTSEDAAGVVYRLGLICFRMCMIFSALRKYENAEMTETIFCTDEDFNNAIQIIHTYLQHSLLMFNNLPKQSETMQFLSGNGKKKFFEALPIEFTRKEATEIGVTFKLSARTVDEVLKCSIGYTLNKIKGGHYQRI